MTQDTILTKQVQLVLGQINDTERLLSTIACTKDKYMCNRPPGASGAALYTERGVSYGSVYPPYACGVTCKTHGCEIVNGHCVRNIHAEVRAILHCAIVGWATKDSVMYSILKPCYECSKIIIAAGIVKVVYAGLAYDEERTQDMLENAGVEMVYIDVGLSYGNKPNR